MLKNRFLKYSPIAILGLFLVFALSWPCLAQQDELPANVNLAAIPAAPNKVRIKAEVLNIARTVYANNEVSMFSLKIIDYKSIEGARPNPGEIEVVAYHKNNDVSLLLEIENGDEIEAVLSLEADERGRQWQIREVEISRKLEQE